MNLAAYLSEKIYAISLVPEGSGQDYGCGYLWWRFKEESYAAVRTFGQMMYDNPHKNLVIVQIITWSNASSDGLVEEGCAFIQAVPQVID